MRRRSTQRVTIAIPTKTLDEVADSMRQGKEDMSVNVSEEILSRTTTDRMSEEEKERLRVLSMEAV